MTEASSQPRSCTFSFEPLDPERVEFLRGRLESSEQAPAARKLRQRLLEEAGLELVWPGYEEDLTRILTRGAFRSGEGSSLVNGDPSQCHRNSARFKDQFPKATIHTGYALSDDGLWRQHSWCMHKGVVVETTTRRLLYFGFELTDSEASEFQWDNLY